MLQPDHLNWYECNGICPDPPRGPRYQFPLPKVKGAPVPSIANYSPQNIAWEIEVFAGLLGFDKSQLVFRYENNTPDDKTDDIFVKHPLDKDYLPTASACNFKQSPELKAYEERAKKSKLLKLYMDNSPAKITYFQQICPNP